MSSSSQSPPSSNTVQAYRMHVSQKYLDLTKQKLELTRLPRDPRNLQQRSNLGISKNDLEPLVDHWLEGYDWRAQETFYNDTLPQYRVPINGTRLHFVHKQSHNPAAIPLLFVQSWPESFIAVSKIIDPLTNPIATPPRGDENVQAFHVVVPSIPGFGFSDPIPEAGNNMQASAEVFDALMKGLGYKQYIVHGTGWGFRIARILALTHPESCIAIHTVNPEVPPPRSSFGYSPDDLVYQNPVSDMSMPSTPGLTPPLTPHASQPTFDRPQTTAYALCDSPSGLLAYILDAIRPPPSSSPSSAATSPSGSPENLRAPYSARSPASPGYATPAPSRSPHSPGVGQSLELPDLSTPWTQTALINWAMLYWLPGPEVALRWLVNSANLIPSLWNSHSSIPLGISHFREPGMAAVQGPPQWAEAYHRIAMVRRRDGAVRFPAWERPAEMVMDIREFAELLGTVGPPVSMEMHVGMPPVCSY